MVATHSNPSTPSFLARTRFRMMLRRAPNFNFFAVRSNLPGMFLPHAWYPNPNQNIPLPGDELQFEELDVRFNVDEDMANYMELHDWLRGLASADEFAEYVRVAATQGSGRVSMLGHGVLSDIDLYVLDSAQNPFRRFTFESAFPVSLSGLHFDVQAKDVEYCQAEVSFRYVKYETESLVNP